MFKFLLLSLTLLAGTSTAALADPLQPPDAALKSTVTRLLVNLREHASLYREDDHAFYEMIAVDVVPRFDVDGIAHFALGRNGRDATLDQRQRFADALARTLVHTYARLLLDCGDSVEVLWSPVHAQAGADHARINTVLSQNGGGQYPVGFSVRLVDGDWKIYDLDIDGISLALNYRVQLNAEIHQSSLDAVIARMGKRAFRTGTAAAL